MAADPDARVLDDLFAVIEARKGGPAEASYTAKLFAAGAPKIARNAPCPCGSGRKYKKCCGRSSPEVESGA